MQNKINPKHWILGFFLGFLIIWVIAFLFGNTLTTYTWSPETGTWIRLPGSVHRQRSEGWGTSHFGRLDVIGVNDVTKIKIPAIAIWGDSHVEALQVEQWERMQEVLIKMWRTNGIKNITAYGIGHSGESVADYYLKIPRYEKNCPNIIAHFIVLSNFEDVLPDQRTEHAVFKSKPRYQITAQNQGPAHRQIKALLGKLGLDFVWLPAKSLIKDTKLQFMPGPNKPKLAGTEVIHETNKENAFSFLLHSLRHQTAKPIIFLYCPSIPKIKDGVVCLKDDNAKVVNIFARECRNNGIGFVDMTQDFCSYYQKTGTFPRGFANSRPSAGHFNVGGHRLVAEAIYRVSNLYLKGN